MVRSERNDSRPARQRFGHEKCGDANCDVYAQMGGTDSDCCNFLWHNLTDAAHETTTRRHLASLAFIAFLAVIYAVILLFGRSRGVEAAVEELPAAASPADTVALEIKSRDSAVTVKNEIKAGRRSSRRKASQPKSIPADIPDVLDRPVSGF